MYIHFKKSQPTTPCLLCHSSSGILHRIAWNTRFDQMWSDKNVSWDQEHLHSQRTRFETVNS